MKFLTIVASMLVLGVLLASCSADRSVAPPANVSDNSSSTLTVDNERLAREIVLACQWEMDQENNGSTVVSVSEDKTSGLCIFDFERENLNNDIFHYSWNVRVGPGPFDVIGIHRVVKERAPNRPIRARESVFMLHGDFKDFTGCFLPGLRSTYYPDDFGIAAYLAQEGIDVWGMDQAHNLIPAGATDFTSMADWDMFKYVHDTRTGMAVARLVRLFTGNGFRKMNLLGFSGGSALGFAVVNEETKLPRGWRHVAGFIPVDQGLVSGDPDFAASDCATSQYYGDLIDAGEYAEPNAFPFFGLPARTDPDGPSDLIPGFTNLQAALAVAIYPYVEGFPYHFLAGTFDTDGLPTGLQYTNVDLWVDFMIEAPPFFANAFSRDEYMTSCGAGYAPWTDQLGEVNIPILYTSAAGGFGLAYEHTLDLLVGADITTLTVSLHPAEEVELDFAHVDLFTADNAPEQVWEPIKAWILSTRGSANETYTQVSDHAFQ